MSEDFKLGSNVEWWSQAQGHDKWKRGKVVQIVMAGSRPDRSYDDLYKGPGCGCSRNHHSYVIKVATGKNGNGKPKHYWPRVSALKKATN